MGSGSNTKTFKSRIARGVLYQLEQWSVHLETILALLKMMIHHRARILTRSCCQQLGCLPGSFDVASDLIQVGKIVTGEESQHHGQGLWAALIVLAGTLQLRW
jgi:hypothetical protein